MDADRALELNGGEDEDDALRRAIAMSMGEAGSQDDGENEGNEAPKSGSESGNHQDATSVTQIDLTSSSPSSPKPNEAAHAPQTSSSMYGLDRKKMEEERLARLKKRKAPESDEPGSQPPQQKVKRSGPPPGIVPPYLSEAISDYRASQSLHEKAAPATKEQNLAFHAKQPKLQYPKGVVKKTWAQGQPRTGEDIKIEEVLQKEELEMAVLSSFIWDDEWLLSKLNLRKTRVILVAFAQDEKQKNEMRANVPKAAIRFCFPPMQAMGAMHSKLQLLKYPTYLRIVVPSGNLIAYDWGERGGFLENIVFLIDLPRIADNSKRDGDQLTPFGEDLSYFLAAQGLDEALIESLRNYDFFETGRYGFVHTIAGSHTGNAWKRTGYCGLGRAITCLKWNAGVVDIDFLVSSIGALNNQFLTAVYNACQGDSGMTEFEARTNKSKSKTKGPASHEVSPTFKDHFRVYFPSRETVLRSRGGIDGAGTICFSSRHWDSPTFPSHDIFRDCVNVRHGLLIHSKVMFIRRHASTPDSPIGSPIGWAYIGSANLSESAWGRLVKDRGTGETKLTCRNWECGVVVPGTMSATGVERETTALATAVVDEGPQMLDMFRGIVPVPIEIPGRRYASDDSMKRPWFFQG